MTAHRFEVLDGLRGVAALVVVSLHVPPFTGHWAPMAGLAVDFFFVLSGFVIAHAYEQRLLSDMGAAEFMARRYIRLWPMFIIGATIGFAAGMLSGWGGFAVKAYAFNAPMIPMVIQPAREYLYPVNLPAWSLFYELVANLMFALLVRRLSNAVLGLVMAAGLATLLIYGRSDMGSALGEWPCALGRVSFSFFAGVAVYRLWKARPSPRIPGVLCVAALIAIFTAPLTPLVLILICPVLVYLAASAIAVRGERELYLTLGAASYGAYVLHAPIARLSDIFVPGDGGPVVLAITYATAVGLALALDRAYDLPLRRRLERLVTPRLRRRATAAI